MDYGFLQGAKGIELQDPMVQASRALTLAQLGGQHQLQQYTMEKARQADADAKAVNAAQATLLQAGYSPEAVQQVLQQNPQNATAILGMVDARKKAQLDQDKERAGIDKDRASTGETQVKTKEIMLKQVGGAAFELANKPDLNPGDIEGLYTKAKTIGLDMTQFGQPQANDSNAWRAHLKQIADFTVNAADKIRFSGDAAQRTETNRHNSNTEAISAAGLQETAQNHRAMEGNASARLNMDRTSAAAPKIMPDADGNLVAIDRNGVARPVTDAEGKAMQGAGKPMTEVQGNATAFGMRAKSANDIINDLEDKGFFASNPVNKLAGGYTNGLAPAQAQQVRQAKLNFMSADLRKESGAAINESEYETEDQKYFPQIGDSNEVIAQKRTARALAIQALTVQAGKQGAAQIGSGQPKAKAGGITKTPQGFGVTDPNGQVHYFPSESRAFEFKQAAGL